MTEPLLPMFGSGLDPGPSFSELLRRVDPTQLPTVGMEPPGHGTAPFPITHGTTVVAIRWSCQHEASQVVQASTQTVDQ